MASLERSRPRLGIMVGQGGRSAGDSLALAIRAERAGFALVAVGDLVADSLALLAAVAVVTDRVRLVAAVAGWTRTPVATVLAARTVDELSGGRLTLGLGPMPKEWSEDWHGVPYARPVERMRDYVGAVRCAFGAGLGSPASHEGEHYRFVDYVRLAPTAAPVPISLGATRAGMTRLAGEVGDGLIANAVHTERWLREVQLPALAEGARAAGRDPRALDVGLMAYCLLDDDEDRAREQLRRELAFYLVTPYFGDVLAHHGVDPRLVERGRAAALAGDLAAAAGAIPDEVVEEACVFGPARACRERLSRYAGLVDWIALLGPLARDASPAEAADLLAATFAAEAGTTH